jgi:hypothetical protein
MEGGIALIGTSGLLTIPTAEVVRDGRMTWGTGYLPPDHYRHVLSIDQIRAGQRHQTYFIVPLWMTFGYLPFLELTVRLTVIPDAPPPAPDIGIYKDGIG